MHDSEPTARAESQPIRIFCIIAGIFCLILLAYANHFQNGFHFDDSHAVLDNPWIRDLRNIPRFFTDGATFSSLPSHRSYRPLVSTSLAIDYWLGQGYRPLWFHLSTFFWYLVQLAAMFPLFLYSFERARPGPWNVPAAFFAVALYGVHPAMAETVNYIVQRGDLYSALGVVAGFALYLVAPAYRVYGFYLIPVVGGILSKAPAAVFPVLLLLWIWLFEGCDLKSAILRSVPAFAVSGAAALLVIRMDPPTFVPGAASAALYRVTQPWILLGYFRKFFIPTGFTADTDESVVSSPFDAHALYGFAFVILLGAFAWWCTRRREMRPVAFGLAWFLVASVPTSVIALAEVENDHRMYFPFVGLAMAACWAGVLAVERLRVSPKILAPACALLLASFAWGTWQRNEVWSADELLWRDVTLKSPRNGRGLMNYGLTLMARGDYAGALNLFNRALVWNPNYYTLEINLGVAHGALGDAAEAERHFARAISLAPDESLPRFYYARWLDSVHRKQEAVAQLVSAARLNPDYVPARYLLMQLDADTGNAAGLRAEAASLQARFPGDTVAASWLARSASLPAAPVNAPAALSPAEGYLVQSLTFFQTGKFRDCIAASRHALQINPGFAEAWNNLGACYNSLSQWDDGIAAEQQAIRFQPDFQLAKNNLAWARDQKRKGIK